MPLKVERTPPWIGFARIFFLAIGFGVMAAWTCKGDERKLDSPPSFLAIGNETGDAVLSMNCKGKSPYSVIECRFLRLDVDKPTDQKVMKSAQEIRDHLKSMSDAAVRKELDGICKDLTEATRRAQDAAAKAGPGQRTYVKKSLELMRSLCDCKTKPCMEQQLLRTVNEVERNTCTVTVQNFKVKFTRAGPHKWISTHGPEGICNIVTVQTLENEPDHSILWTFTQTTPTADTSGLLCGGIELNKPDRFTWHSSADFALGCDTIGFSIFSLPEP
jgi:hypothetical protein